MDMIKKSPIKTRPKTARRFSAKTDQSVPNRRQFALARRFHLCKRGGEGLARDAAVAAVCVASC